MTRERELSYQLGVEKLDKLKALKEQRDLGMSFRKVWKSSAVNSMMAQIALF